MHCFSELGPSQYVLHPPERTKKGINNQTFQKTSYCKSGGVLNTDRNCVGMQEQFDLKSVLALLFRTESFTICPAPSPKKEKVYQESDFPKKLAMAILVESSTHIGAVHEGSCKQSLRTLQTSRECVQGTLAHHQTLAYD